MSPSPQAVSGEPKHIISKQYLSAFNMVVHFRPRRLGEKPDSLTRGVDY